MFASFSHCFPLILWEKMFKRQKGWFWPANSGESTCSLVEIHNTCLFNLDIFAISTAVDANKIYEIYKNYFYKVFVWSRDSRRVQTTRAKPIYKINISYSQIAIFLFILHWIRIEADQARGVGSEDIFQCMVRSCYFRSYSLSKVGCCDNIYLFSYFRSYSPINVCCCDNIYYIFYFRSY